MIRITVELVSAIHPDRNTTLGVATIVNDGKTSIETKGKRGSYNLKFSKRAPKLNETWSTGRVENFDRKNRGVWDLLYLGLKSALEDRNE